MNKKPNVVCEYCGKEFFKQPSQQKIYKHHFCCFECWSNSRKLTNKYIIKDNYAEMILESQKYGTQKALIDIQDIEKVKMFRWGLLLDRTAKKQKFYVQSSVRGNKNILLHRIITQCPEDKEVDHINHNPLDNRRSNLKICSHKENMQNYKI